MQSDATALDNRETPDGDLVEAVLGYFLRHPQASDSVEGIARWRLLEETARIRLEETARAVEWLTSEGYLVEERAPGLDPVYRLGARRPGGGGGS